LVIHVVADRQGSVDRGPLTSREEIVERLDQPLRKVPVAGMDLTEQSLAARVAPGPLLSPVEGIPEREIPTLGAQHPQRGLVFGFAPGQGIEVLSPGAMGLACERREVRSGLAGEQGDHPHRPARADELPNQPATGEGGVVQVRRED
jgi:hypothetical protein